MLKLPPTSAFIWLACTVAPFKLVSPPLFIVAVLPAEIFVFVKLVSCALLLPLPLLESFFVAARLNWVCAQIKNTIKSGAACARIHWDGVLFDRVNASLLNVLGHFDDLRRALEVPDGLLLLLMAVSATAIKQPRRWLKTIRWKFLFMERKWPPS